MRSILAYAGPVVFLLIALNFATKYGENWRFGRYGMPHTATTSNGRLFADGTPVDPITKQIALSGIEEEVTLILTMVAVICGTAAIAFTMSAAEIRLQLARQRLLDEFYRSNCGPAHREE